MRSRPLPCSAVSLAALMLLAASPALADAPPPPNYVEKCTRAYQEADGEYCEEHEAGYQDEWGCLADPWGSERCSSHDGQTQEQCCADRIADGWQYRCQTAGASAFDTLWCRARQPGDAERPARPAGSDDCAAGGTAAPAALLLVLVVIAIRGRRRHLDSE